MAIHEGEDMTPFKLPVLAYDKVQVIVEFGNLIGLDWAIVLTEACKKNGRPLDSIPMGWRPEDVVEEVFSKTEVENE